MADRCVCSVDPTANETIQLDYKPLLQCIHIHDALDSRSELQRSYQEDRRVRWIGLLQDSRS